MNKIINNYSLNKIIFSFKVLKDALKLLNEWESNLNKKLIKDDEFLSSNTAEGIRVTIISTIDLITHLHNCGFQYVLTAKINQDCIEV